MTGSCPLSGPMSNHHGLCDKFVIHFSLHLLWPLPWAHDIKACYNIWWYIKTRQILVDWLHFERPDTRKKSSLWHQRSVEAKIAPCAGNFTPRWLSPTTSKKNLCCVSMLWIPLVPDVTGEICTYIILRMQTSDIRPRVTSNIPTWFSVVVCVCRAKSCKRKKLVRGII